MNDDLISRKALLKKVKHYGLDNGSSLGKHSGIAEILISAIEFEPAINAVPVVRCKDCTFKEKAEVNSKDFRICPASGMEITDDDFCSYGDGKRGYLHDDSN